MRGAIARFRTQLVLTLRNPRRLRKLFDPVGRRSALHRLCPPVPHRDWRGASRGYASYAEYLEHQGSKLDTVAEIAAWDEEWEATVRKRLQAQQVETAGRSALCLAARLGGEVRALRRLGAFAVGVDLNPGDANRWVLPGDFHVLDFPDNSVDIVFTNSLDHALDVERVAREVRRVLKPDGLFLVEAMAGSTEGGRFQDWEATRWERLSDLVDRLCAPGFLVAKEYRFDKPWPGCSLHLRLSSD